MDFRQPFNYFFRNNTTTAQPASFKIGKADIMKNNLNKKMIRIPKFYCNNTGAVPLFIPDRITSQTSFNILFPTAPGNYSVIGNTLDVNSLDYYIILEIGGYAVTSFLRFNNNYSTNPPPSHILSNDVSYYQNPYYYMYDFTKFIDILIKAITDAKNELDVLASVSFTNISPVMLMNTRFQLLCQFMAPQSTGGYYLYMSEKLFNLFPFKSKIDINSGYRYIDFDSAVTVNYNSNPYYENDAVIYDTIFPFVEMLFNCDDGNLNAINFIGNEQLNNNQQSGIYENSILSYNISTNNIYGVYNFYKYINENDTNWVNFDSNKSDKPHLTINVYLRLKNNIIIPYLINPLELFTFTLECKYVE